MGEMTHTFSVMAERNPPEYGADLLVAGAYGHARLREWAFVALHTTCFDVPLVARF
jgi:nucleotide-binding universal stress UspA family protein